MADLLTAPQLVVSQRAKLIELTNQYEIRDAEGGALGYVQQEGQSGARKVLRFVTDVDQFLTHRLTVYDATGWKVVALTRPAKLVKSRLLVDDGTGRRVGEIVQRKVFGKILFDLLGREGELLGQIRAENWRAWDFSIVDAAGREIARIDKKFVGIAKAVFTNADNYVVDIADDVRGDIRLLVVAAATAVDTALKQDPGKLGISDGLNLFD
jgi:uncharacterized protein YxjI